MITDDSQMADADQQNALSDHHLLNDLRDHGRLSAPTGRAGLPGGQSWRAGRVAGRAGQAIPHLAQKPSCSGTKMTVILADGSW